MATLIALFFSLLLIKGWGFYFDPLPTDVISYTEGFYGLGFLMALMVALSWKRIRITPLTVALFAYPVFTFAIALFTATRVIPNALYLVPIWLIVTGLATDGLLWLLKQSSAPSWSDLKQKILSSKGVLAYEESIDELAEVTAQAVDRHEIATANRGLNLFSTVYDKIGTEEGTEVKILYPQEILEMIGRSAIEKGLTITAQKVFTTLGTLGLECLKIRPELAPFALVKIEQGTLAALKKNLHELFIKGCITLQQTALLAPESRGWGSFIAQAARSLDFIAKESFKKDKTQSIAALISPIIELDNRLKGYEKSPEYPIAKMEINRVIEEFQTLDAVMRQMPHFETPKA